MSSPSADLQTDKRRSITRRCAAVFPAHSVLQKQAGGSTERRRRAELRVQPMGGSLAERVLRAKGIPRWTLEDAGGDPPRYPNAY